LKINSIIGEWIAPSAKVLDLGCGDGELLAWLKSQKKIEARGVELDRESVQKAVARGVTVYQSDIEESLEGYPDKAFDYVILSQTLQEVRHPLTVLSQMMRTGRWAIVAFPNFGHWRVRLSHLVSGRAPRTTLFPYQWYESPNIHFLTVVDFEEMIAQQKWHIEKRRFVSRDQTVGFMPNLLAEVAVYLLTAP